MLGDRSGEQWVTQYATSHHHPVNRACHTLGIPSILVSVALFLAAIFVHRLWIYAAALFLFGWALQFVGHAFEGKPPEFFHRNFSTIGAFCLSAFDGGGPRSTARRSRARVLSAYTSSGAHQGFL